jgi:hypothetical protein
MCLREEWSDRTKALHRYRVGPATRPATMPATITSHRDKRSQSSVATSGSDLRIVSRYAHIRAQRLRITAPATREAETTAAAAPDCLARVTSEQRCHQRQRRDGAALPVARCSERSPAAGQGSRLQIYECVACTVHRSGRLDSAGLGGVAVCRDPRQAATPPGVPRGRRTARHSVHPGPRAVQGISIAPCGRYSSRPRISAHLCPEILNPSSCNLRAEIAGALKI